jgi:cupin 2 domain-containing protein
MTSLGPNLLSLEPAAQNAEVTQPLAIGKGVRLERVVSLGQSSPDDFWYDQSEAEWVTILSGRARIRIADQESALTMGPGDTLLLPAHCRHRVEWTDPDQPTVWLALFVAGELSEVQGSEERSLEISTGRARAPRVNARLDSEC